MVSPREQWLAATWPFVAAQLPPPPGRALEIGCGSAGGFVPDLRRAGYRATGVDPQAPDGPDFDRVEFENRHIDAVVEVIVACTSLHHVADLGAVLDKVADALVPGGTLVVVEMAWERFDDATAQWSFARLPESGPGSEPGWLQAHRDRWDTSAQPWPTYFTAWATGEGMHTEHDILDALQERFDTRAYAEGPYFFPELLDVTEAMEQAAIDSGEIQAVGSRYVGQARGLSRRSPG